MLDEEVGVRLRVGDDEIGHPEGLPVDAAENARRHRAAPKARAVGDERVLERDERVEDDRPPERRDLRRRQVEVAGVADDQRVEPARGPEQRELRDGHFGAGPEARRPVLPAAPDRDVSLLDLDTRSSQARDRERVPRVVPLVGPEVKDAH